MKERLQLATITPADLPDQFIRNIRYILTRAQAGPEKDRWPGGEGSPDLILLLLRAAPIPFAAVRGCADAHAIPLPPVIEAHIGSELFRQYGEERELGRGFSFMLLDDAERRDYRAWLDDNKYVQAIIARMKRDAAAAGVPGPGRIMVYDDFESESSTLHAARHLLSRAFPDATIEVSVPMVDTSSIISALLPDLPLSKEKAKFARDFLFELAKGYRETPAGLAPLDSPQQLRRLGQQARYRRGSAYSTLANLYGDEQLLAFPDRVREAFRASGQSIDPTPPLPPKTAWLLTGAPGIGKTTIVQKTVTLLQKYQDGKSGPDGFVTVVNEEGSGYDLVALGGKRVPLATAGEHDFTDPAPVTLPDSAGITVDRAAVETMVRETLALALLGQTAVIDEIGLLLIASDAFSKHLWWLLEHGSGAILGTITSHSHPFIDRMKAHPVVELVEVTEENREALPEELAERLAAQIQGHGLLEEIVQLGSAVE